MSSDECDALIGVRGVVGMLLALLGDCLLASLLDLDGGVVGTSLPIMTAALGRGCSIQATSSGPATLRVVGGCSSLTAGLRVGW